jgi:signal transduction histidine kinase
MRKILLRYFDKSLPFRVRTFNILALTGMGLSALSTINGILSAEVVVVIASAAAGLLSAVLMWLFTFTRLQLLVKIVTVTVIFGTIFPFIYFHQGEIPAYGVIIFALGVLFSSLLFEKKRNAILITIALTLYDSFFIILSFFPPFHNGEVDVSILREVLISFYVNCIAISATVIWLIDAYERDAEKLRIQSEEKVEFLSTFSHELKTPLTSIKGFAQYGASVMKNPSDDPADDKAEILGSFESIKNAAERLDRMGTQLLDVTMIEQGIIGVNLAPCNFNDIAMQIRGDFEKQSQSNNTLHVQENTSLPIIKADPDKLVQVLLNLIKNANKHTENGVITLTAEPEEKHVNIAVSDTGSGIPEELIPYLFKKFPQAEIGGMKTDHGLGLYICKSYMTAMGGEIALANTSGEGTRFVVTLPVLEQSVT